MARLDGPVRPRPVLVMRYRAAKRRALGLGACALGLFIFFIPSMLGIGLPFGMAHWFAGPAEDIAPVTAGIYSTTDDVLAELQDRANAQRQARKSFKEGPPRLYGFEVVAEYKHDPKAFTQGLVYGGAGILYESTGLHGHSTVREVDLESGKVLKRTKLPGRAFGEGLAYCRGQLLQLTWQESTGYVYNPSTLALEGSFTTDLGDGWGLTTDPVTGNLWATTGAASLFLLNSTTFVTESSVPVTDGGRPVKWVNELEYIDGEIWANVWQTDCIARIDPASGRVLGWVLLQELTAMLRARPGAANMDVLNGIALDHDTGRLLVTGKQWPALFHIRLKDLDAPEAAVANARHLCIHA